MIKTTQLFLILTLLTLTPLSLFSQEKDKSSNWQDNVKSFVGLSGTKSFLNNKTRYYDFNFGIRAKCRYRIGFNYGWLVDGYESDVYSVDQTAYPNATHITKTKIKFYSLLFDPVIIKGKVINISIPVHFGITELKSKFLRTDDWYQTYHLSHPFYSSIAMNMDLKIFAFLKIGLVLGYRAVFSEFEVAKNEFNTPFIAFGLKFGGMCK